jgi:hypothetical protein
MTLKNFGNELRGNMLYDLAVIGDGIFGNVFLHEINGLVNKSQNFTVAHIYEEKLAPMCSLRTTSTVSQNGVEEGISPLGDLLLNSFSAFVDFYQHNKDYGIIPSKQFIFTTIESKKAKLKRRFKEQIGVINSPYFHGIQTGVVIDSYIISPDTFFSKIKSTPKNFLKTDFIKLVKCVEEKDNFVLITFVDDTTIQAKKVLLATGAYSKIFPGMFQKTTFAEKINETKVVAGSYLIKKANFETDLYFTINGHNLVYRKATKELIIGSTEYEGALMVPEVYELKKILADVSAHVTFDLGSIDEYKAISGIRHKGHRRMPTFEPISENQRIWFANGAYKNGWSLPFYFSKKFGNLFV